MFSYPGEVMVVKMQLAETKMTLEGIPLFVAKLICTPQQTHLHPKTKQPRRQHLLDKCSFFKGDGRHKNQW